MINHIAEEVRKESESLWLIAKMADLLECASWRYPNEDCEEEARELIKSADKYIKTNRNRRWKDDP